MILRSISGVFAAFLAMLAGFYVATWRVKRRLHPAALLFDEGLQSLQFGLFKTTMAKGHFGGRPVSLRIHLSRWSRTLVIGLACDSPQNFALWTPGPRGAPRSLPLEGYLALVASEFGRAYAATSHDSSSFLAWLGQPRTKERLSALATARDDWRLELQSSTLEWTDFTCRDDEFVGPTFASRLALLAEIASSLEPAAVDAGSPAPGDSVSRKTGVIGVDH